VFARKTFLTVLPIYVSGLSCGKLTRNKGM
jgi:hypothetical protein